MQLTHKSCPDFCPQRSAPTLGSPRRSIAVAVILAASLGAAACGSSGSPTILNTEKVERASESSALTQPQSARRGELSVWRPSEDGIRVQLHGDRRAPEHAVRGHRTGRLG
jgi:hypothetical protein